MSGNTNRKEPENIGTFSGLQRFLLPGANSRCGIDELAMLQELTAHRYTRLYSQKRKRQLPKTGYAIPLPEPDLENGKSFPQVVLQRRSIRSFKKQSISLNTLSTLLYLTYGITHSESHFLHPFNYRAAPSAGALYPIEIMVRIHNGEESQEGLYLYNCEKHELIQVLQTRQVNLHQALLEQHFASEAPILLILVAFPDRIVSKYGIRSYRYMLLDSGHIAQNIYLAATALDLGACEIGAFYDDLLNQFCELDGVNGFVTTCMAVGIRES